MKPVDLGETNPSRHVVNYMSIHIWWCFCIADSIHFLGELHSKNQSHQCSWSHCLSRKEPILPKDGTVFSVPFTNNTMPEPSLENLRANMPKICRGTLQLVQFQLLNFKQRNRRNQVAQKSGRTGSVLTYPVPTSEISMHVVSVCLSTSHLFERKLMQGFSFCSLLKVVLLKRRILRPVNAIDQAYS